MTARGGSGGGNEAVAPVIILDVSGNVEGHRGQYHRLLCDQLHARCLPFSWRIITARQPVLMAMIEEAPGRYVLTCLLRSLQGKRTAGFLFRPLPALQATSWRLRIKRWVLRVLRLIPCVQTLTILPFAIEPRFAEIADGWIYDPQFWDLYAEGAAPVADTAGPLAGNIRAAAAGRTICTAIGRQDVDKGFDQFARLYLAEPGLRARALFAFGGKVTGDLAVLSSRFAAAGGFACNRFISDAELLDLYGSADLIWCAYAAHYDQASGIFGRAMQLGIPVVVRRGSLIHRFCELEGLAHLAFDETSTAASFGQWPMRADGRVAADRARAFGCETMTRLRAALGLVRAA